MSATLQSPEYLFYAQPRAMTRCECSGAAFSDVARVMTTHACSHEQAMDLTGAGRLCGACVPDLELDLASLNLL